MNYLPVALHAAITLLAVVSVIVKAERRLTKIETDLTWIKKSLDNFCKAADHCEPSEETKTGAPA